MSAGTGHAGSPNWPSFLVSRSSWCEQRSKWRLSLRIDLDVAAAGLLVGFTVGLTGMGGGALMTPLLVLLFKVQPLTAISSDLVAAVIMKPVGGGVHLRRGTVNFALVRWLTVGSVPAAFAGVLVLRHLGDGAVVQARIKQALGVALLLAASSIAAKALLQIRRAALGMAGEASAAAQALPAAAAAHRADRGSRRAGGRHDLGRLRVPDDRDAAGALPHAALLGAGRHRPGPSDPTGRLRRGRPPA